MLILHLFYYLVFTSCYFCYQQPHLRMYSAAADASVVGFTSHGRAQGSHLLRKFGKSFVLLAFVFCMLRKCYTFVRSFIHCLHFLITWILIILWANLCTVDTPFMIKLDVQFIVVICTIICTVHYIHNSEILCCSVASDWSAQRRWFIAYFLQCLCFLQVCVFLLTNAWQKQLQSSVITKI